MWSFFFFFPFIVVKMHSNCLAISGDNGHQAFQEISLPLCSPWWDCLRIKARTMTGESCRVCLGILWKLFFHWQVFCMQHILAARLIWQLCMHCICYDCLHLLTVTKWYWWAAVPFAMGYHQYQTEKLTWDTACRQQGFTIRCVSC
jgi:hypothetical protein